MALDRDAWAQSSISTPARESTEAGQGRAGQSRQQHAALFVPALVRTDGSSRFFRWLIVNVRAGPDFPGEIELFISPLGEARACARCSASDCSPPACAKSASRAILRTCREPPRICSTSFMLRDWLRGMLFHL